MAEPRTLRAIALVSLVIFCSLWLMHAIDRLMPPSHSDLIPRWVGTQEALKGRDPYSTPVLREIQKAYYGRVLTDADLKTARPQYFFYPATIVVLLAPFSSLPWSAVRAGFLVLVVLGLVLGTYMCVHLLNVRIPGRQMILIVLLVLFSWPVMWGLRLQQPTLLAAVLIFCGAFFLSRGFQVVPGILLGVSTFKPQCSFLLIAWLGLWALLGRRWRFLASLAATFAALMAIAEMLVPGWIPRWLAVVGEYGSTTHTEFPLGQFFGHWIGIVGTICILVYGGLILWRLRHCEFCSSDFARAISLILAMEVCGTPSDMPMIYNNVLLLPACLLLLLTKPKSSHQQLLRRLVLASVKLGFATVALAAVLDLLFGPLFVAELPFAAAATLPVLVAAGLLRLAESDRSQAGLEPTRREAGL